ncbi:HST [Symbiodinium sp. CCMP2456]|nr:HST [Symbiodinium sp. CCMP2456]
MLGINNSSKRELPDFGSGKCNAVLTNAGPTLLLPAKGGIEVFLDNSVFRCQRFNG